MTARAPSGRFRRWTVAVAAVLALGAPVALAGCTTPRNGLGTPVDTCYRALPVAAQAVHHRGSFAGVVLVGRRALAPDHRLARLVDRRGGRDVRTLCIVAFHGSFDAAQVRDPAGGGTGRRPWAVVVVSTPANRLLGTVLLSRPPFSLRDLL